MFKTFGGKRKTYQQCPSLAPRSTLGDVQARITWRRRDVEAGTVLRVFQIGDDFWAAENPDAARRYAAAKHGSMAAATARSTHKGVVEVPGTTTIQVPGANPTRPIEKTVAEWLREAAAAGMAGVMEAE